MLKPIRRVACSPALSACRRLQEHLVAWLCDVNVGPADIIQADLVPPQVPTQIEADWLWMFLQRKDNKKPLLDRAKVIAGMSPDEKIALLSWVQTVSQLPAQFQPNPSTAWPTAQPVISEVAWNAFKELMLAFYKKGFNGGLPYKSDGKPVNNGGLTYAQFVKAFRDEHRLNSDPNAREVCVLCGGPLGQTPQVDHWIAESDYPLLSICADNLLPVCEDCNSTTNKGQKPVHSAGIFSGWFHPYLRPANGGIWLDYDVQTRSITATAKSSTETAKVANLDKLLNLSERWTREFKMEYAKQQGILIQRERRRINKGQTRHTQNEILIHLQSIQDDLIPTEPHYEVHSVLCTAMFDQARLAAWETELGLVT